MTRPGTFVDVLRDRAEGALAQKGFTFLAEGDQPERRLDYAELDQRARALGEQLAARFDKGDRAILVFDAGFDFVVSLFGCLYAGIVAVPVLPPNPLNPQTGLTHLDRVSGDASARFGLSTAALLARLAPLLSGLKSAGTLEWIDASALDEPDGRGRFPMGAEDDAAILQYTSGSTSDPRGVILTHRNLIRNASFIGAAFGLSENSRSVSWLPHHHDMGLMGGILEPLSMGMDCAFLSPQAFLQRPLTCLQAITRFGGTICGGPNFAYDLLARRVPDAEKPQLDLSTWSVAFCGAEPVRPATLDAFARAFAECGFRRESFLPCYGLAEATLMVSGSHPAGEPRRLSLESPELERGRAVPCAGDVPSARTFVSCGSPPPGIEVVVTDPDTRTPCPTGSIGEIWVRGPNIARGYWANPEATKTTFGASLSSGGEGYLRTGDSGFLDQGELFVTGRLKDLIIIHGRNLAPHDIELTVEHAHPAVRPTRCAAFSIDISGHEQLVVAFEVGRRAGPLAAEIEGAVRRSVASVHGVAPHAVVLLAPSQLPRTTSGKPRRSLCRQRYLDGSLPGSPP